MIKWLDRKFIFELERDTEAENFEVKYLRFISLADRPIAQQEAEVKELLDDGIIAKLNAYFRKLEAEGDKGHGYDVLPKNAKNYAACFSDDTFSDMLIAYYGYYE